MQAVDLRLEVQRIHAPPEVPTNARLRGWCMAALTGVARLGATQASAVGVTLRIVDAAEMRALNGAFRGRDYATNVLAFPNEPLRGVPVRRVALGDIVVCAPIVTDEAVAQGKPPFDHWAHLIVHGTLHLLGFDHEDSADAERMEALERQVLAGCGIADPYA